MDLVRFTLNDRRYELSRATVEMRLLGVTPETVRKHAVRVNGTWFPAVQAFEVALGVPRAQFISHTARRHLSALGFEVFGDVDSRHPSASAERPAPVRAVVPAVGAEWHTEANVQALLVAALAMEGWRILSVANTATKERGVDVVAERNGRTAGIEVKGYPSRGYADPTRAGEAKKTAPSNQAGHWYAQAVLAAMRLRSRHVEWRSVIALPDFARYQDLYAETRTSLGAAQIEVWWVAQDGAVNRRDGA